GVVLIACCACTPTPYTERSPLSLHDALPISGRRPDRRPPGDAQPGRVHDEAVSDRAARDQRSRRRRGSHRGWHPQRCVFTGGSLDRKSTRLNSSHVAISYAVFCLKKKKIQLI